MKRKFFSILSVILIITMISASAGASGLLDNYHELINSFRKIGLLISEDYIWDFDGENLMSIVEWEMLVLDEESARTFPELAAKLEMMKQAQTEAAGALSAEMGVIARDIYSDTERTESCSAEFDYYVQRADNKALSFRSDSYLYWGGAHPDYGTAGINIDVKTGEELALGDVVNDTYALTALLARKVEEKYSDISVGDIGETILSLNEEEFEWTLGYEEITFYFNPYVILPYAAGKVTAAIRYDEAEELFDPEYLPAYREAYAVRIPVYEACEIDLDPTDGKRDVLEIYPLMNEYEGYSTFDIVINGQSWPIEAYAYEFDLYLVVTDTGEEKRYFLYLETIETDSYTTLMVVDLNGEIPQVVDELWGSGFTGGMYTGKAVFADPSDFVLETRLDIIGTRFGNREYSVDVLTGRPIPLQDYFGLDHNGYPITSLIPITVVMLDTSEEEVIPAGTDFRGIRSDGETYMDFILEDGRECRIMVDTSDYPYLINGIDEYECFDGFVYAG